MRPGHKLTADDRANLADARSRCPDLDTLTDLARGFTALVRHQGAGQHLDTWIDRARHAGHPASRQSSDRCTAARTSTYENESSPRHDTTTKIIHRMCARAWV
ncbi:hypothetical protein OOK41_03565 [Micromonospora sp. NBC_01655]|uniref:hypothetical protein n=1 Tax=Micromonospora sp. NBC_01655 TaxID=2975983 RepID=UPI002253DB9D|nr:hypothetical protein [Micromonospora sp. NBC_01655]MCX4469395.1 hypothetical protein [Micromonospora sp. NBC_01655]